MATVLQSAEIEPVGVEIARLRQRILDFVASMPQNDDCRPDIVAARTSIENALRSLRKALNIAKIAEVDREIALKQAEKAALEASNGS